MVDIRMFSVPNFNVNKEEFLMQDFSMFHYATFIRMPADSWWLITYYIVVTSINKFIVYFHWFGPRYFKQRYSYFSKLNKVKMLYLIVAYTDIMLCTKIF